jgi:hypothetical protein
MIAAIYARKSTDQNGVSEAEKSVTRQIEHATRRCHLVADLLHTASLRPEKERRRARHCHESSSSCSSTVLPYFLSSSQHPRHLNTNELTARATVRTAAKTVAETVALEGKPPAMKSPRPPRAAADPSSR